MRKVAHERTPNALYRHRISFIIIAAAVIATSSILVWYTTTTNTTIKATQANTATKSAADDIKIKAIKAKKAAELQAKQEADAKLAADQAQTATNETASTVDSTRCNTARTHIDPGAIDVVVNKKHCVQPVTFVPNDLVAIGGGYVLSAKAAPSFNELMAAANAAGVPLAVTSSYRSYSSQVSTYAYWVNTSGKTGADTYSARPGYSEHQTGLAFDVSSNGCVLSCFGSSSAYAWMQENASTYGFIQRYYTGSEATTGYTSEEWHYRYVGVVVAKDMQAKGIPTLEQYWGVTGGDY